MLEKLDQVQWHTLKHAYGSAADVPDLLRLLASPDPEVRQKVLWTLYSNIYHQGTVYEATAYAVPFIVEVLEMLDTHAKHDILDLLFHLAHGHSYIDVHQHLTFTYDEETRNSQAFKDELQRELSWVKAAHDAVAEHYDVYLRLLTEGDERTQLMAVILLGNLPSNREKIAPHLHRYLITTTNATLQMAILYVVAKVFLGQEDLAAQIINPYLASENELVQFFAAVAMVQLQREKVSQDVLLILANALDDTSFEKRYGELFWVNDSFYGLVSAMFCLAGFQATEPYIPKLITPLALHWYTIYALLYLLLDNKPLPEGTTGKNLTDLQRQAITAIGQYALHTTSSAGVQMINLEVADLLDHYGLPSTPEDLKTFLNT